MFINPYIYFPSKRSFRFINHAELLDTDLLKKPSPLALCEGCFDMLRWRHSININGLTELEHERQIINTLLYEL